MSEKPDIFQVLQSYTALKKVGNEYIGICPLHKEKTASFYVDTAKQVYYCHGCSVGGDVYDFVKRFYGVDFKKSKEILLSAPTVDIAKAVAAIPKRITSKPPANTPAPSFVNGWFGSPVSTWEYRDTDGEIIHYVCRYEKDGKKAYPQWTWSNGEWGMGHYSGRRPLYGLDKLAQRPDAPVMICEGEKSADAAQIMLPDYVCVTWSGGAGAINKADWKPLDNRKLIFWPDCDEAGAKTIIEMRKLYKNITVLEFNRDNGWDAANALEEGMTAEQIFMEKKEEESPNYYEEDEVKKFPFELLGYDGDSYFYLATGKGQVTELKSNNHSVHNLFQLAPLQWWESAYPTRGEKFPINVVASSLMAENHKLGIYSPDRVRGRGAWLDNGRNVIHLGECLLVNGEPHAPGRIGSKFIYEAKLPIDIKRMPAAKTAQANRLVDLCEMLSWENPISAALLAGWLVIAPVCGVLKWRPHIWITGPARAGKSTVMNDIAGKMVGPFALRIDGKTTEAAIRQFLGADARPVLFDEAEGEDQVAAKRMQGVIELARVASSGGFIGKGSSSGKAQGYTVRSCFCFSSINTSVAQYADETRISKLVLRRDESDGADERYQNITKVIDGFLNEDYASAMFHRSVENMVSLERNAVVFKDAAAAIFKDRRAADQIGTMLAGLYLCYSNKEVSVETATKWIESRQWGDHTALTASSDEMRLLTQICSLVIKVPSLGATKDVTVGDALVAVFNGNNDNFNIRDAERTLGALGLKILNDQILIADNSPQLARALENTPWSRDWRRPLRMLPGASQTPSSKYFAAGLTQRATSFPVSLIEGTP